MLMICMSQQFHAWSHMKKSDLEAQPMGAAVIWAQDAGLLISRKAHGAHHRPPFESNYCIVSGLWNPLLDRSQFFKKLEKLIHATTGVPPRSWDLPEEWYEQQQPQA